MTQTKPLKFIVLLMAGLLSLTACQNKRDSSTEVEVLVEVGDEAITRKDLDHALLKLLGPEKAVLADEKAKQKILESLVVSRAIAQKLSRTLTEDELQHLEIQVKDYREQLLVKRYLRKNIKPQPVTQSMARDYYEKNRQRFGEIAVRDYELISSKERLQGSERERVLKALADAANKTNWQTYTKSLLAQGINVSFRSGKADEKLLHATLKTMLKNTGLKEASKPFFIEGKAYVVRVTKEQQLQARPFDEVSAEIRKALAPVQLKKAISSISDEILKETRIKYSQ